MYVCLYLRMNILMLFYVYLYTFIFYDIFLYV